MKKTVIVFLCSSLLFGSAIFPITSVMAAEEVSTQEIATELHLTAAQEKKATEIENEVQRLNCLPEQQRNEEIAQILAEVEGQEFYFGEQTGIMSRAAASTNAKIINGGINFFAYNREGVNKLANSLGKCALGNTTLAAVAGFIAAYAPGVGTKAAAALIGGFSGLISRRFGDARAIVRKKTTKAGVRVTATETLDITNKGINAYK